MAATPSKPQAASAAPTAGRRGTPSGTVARKRPGQVPAGPPIARPETPTTPTPKLLRAWFTFTLLSLIAFTVLGVLSLTNARSALAGAGESIGQLSRVEQVRTDVLRADAAAAHELLTGQDGDYGDTVAEARATLVEAAAHSPSDASSLAEVNRELDAYTAKLEEARLGRGTPAGEEALVAAAAMLRTQVLPPLNTLVETNSGHVDASTAGVSRVPLALSGILALAGLVGTALTLSIRFRRLVNLGITAAILLVAASWAIGLSALTTADTQAQQVVHNEIVTFQESAAARGSAYDARAQEALALIQRRTDPAADQPWSNAADRTRTALERIPTTAAYDLHVAWDRYVEAHGDLRVLATQGEWDEAQRQIVQDTGPAAGGRFVTFDTAVTDAMTNSSTQSRMLITSLASSVTLSTLVIGFGGLVAILCSWAGVRPRLQEYA